MTTIRRVTPEHDPVAPGRPWGPPPSQDAAPTTRRAQGCRRVSSPALGGGSHGRALGLFGAWDPPLPAGARRALRRRSARCGGQPRSGARRDAPTLARVAAGVNTITRALLWLLDWRAYVKAARIVRRSRGRVRWNDMSPYGETKTRWVEWAGVTVTLLSSLTIGDK